jgi:hypothetical protein
MPYNQTTEDNYWNELDNYVNWRHQVYRVMTQEERDYEPPEDQDDTQHYKKVSKRNNIPIRKCPKVKRTKTKPASYWVWE